MARTAGRRIPQQPVVVQQQDSVDLGDANGVVALTLRCPGDNANVLDMTLISTTAGTGTSANHLVTLQDVDTDTDLTGVATLDADGTAQVTEGSANGVLGHARLALGARLQLNNTESAAISNGAIVTVIIRWIL